ncbi:MAG: phenylalanine--tRNA ligase subunit beta, partial [Chloroflexota bacterium]
RLVLATVDYGQATLTVVTGAPNIAQGQRVALALAGARLYDGHSEERVLKTLKPGMIRGVKSEGMVCSEKELGMSDEHEGILVLEADAPVGSPLQAYLGDTVIEFEITPNLVHAFSVVGIAREVGALTYTSVRLPDAPTLTSIAEDRSLARVEDPKLCARYIAVRIDGITVGPSPAWMQRRLVAAGLRPINNVVDVTNYVMLEWGQPTHAFDAARIDGGTIVVRRARLGETIETLDHQQRELQAGMLVIADSHHPIGVAGVMGGFESEVTEATTSIILESANFDMKSIRSTSRALKLRTDASARYERGIDPNLCADAAGRIVQLLMEMCPGARAVGIVDLYPDPVMPRDMVMPFGEFERLIGVPYSPEVVEDALARLGFGVDVRGDTLAVSIPTWRTDVTQPADIVEEVARVVGYEHLPETLPRGETAAVYRDPVYMLSRGMRSTLVGCGGYETLTYTTIGEAQLSGFTNDADSGFLHRVPMNAMLRLRNPLQSERPMLRTTLVPSLVETVAANLRHQRGVRLFEIARAYLPTGGELPDERPVVAMALAGARDPLSRFGESEMMDFFDVKGMVESVLDRSGVPFHVHAATAPGLHPGRTAEIFSGDARIGLMGELRPDVAA